MRPNAIVGSMFEPILRVVLTALALALGAGLTGSLIMLQVASVIASVVAWIWLRRLMHGHARLKPVFHTGVLVRFGLVTWASSVALEGIRWADVQVLAVLTTADVVAEYQVATRTVLFCALAVNALTGALAPRAADLLRRGELSVVRRLYVTTSAILVRITLPLLVVVLVQADWLLTIFGRDYTGAAWISRILVFGVLYDTAVGAAGPILNMAGLQLYNLFDNSGGLILNVTLNVILVPEFHGLGAAVAWTLTFFALGTARILQVKGKVLSVLPFSSPMWNMLHRGRRQWAGRLLAAPARRSGVGGLPRRRHHDHGLLRGLDPARHRRRRALGRPLPPQARRRPRHLTPWSGSSGRRGWALQSSSATLIAEPGRCAAETDRFPEHGLTTSSGRACRAGLAGRLSSSGRTRPRPSGAG